MVLLSAPTGWAQEPPAADRAEATPEGTGTAEGGAAQGSAAQAEPAPAAAGERRAEGSRPAAEGGWEGDDEAEWGDVDAPGADRTPAPGAKAREASAAGAAPESVAEPSSELSAGGFLRSRTGLWTERMGNNPLAQARQSADLWVHYRAALSSGADPWVLRVVAGGHVEYDLAYLNKVWTRSDGSQGRYDDATIDTYRSQIIGGETYAALGTSNAELTLGRQIVAWGQGEILSPLDVVNPRDYREPGLTDPEDLRIAVLASRLGLFFGRHRFETMVIHESYFGLWPQPMSPLSPYRTLLAPSPADEDTLRRTNPSYVHYPGRFDLGAQQALQSWSFTGEGFDLALYAASVFERQGVPSRVDQTDQTHLKVLLEHPRYEMLGHAGAVPIGDFLLRWELGTDLNRPMPVMDRRQDGFNACATYQTQVNGMLGFMYSGIEDGSIAVEAQQAYVPNNPERTVNGTVASPGSTGVCPKPPESNPVNDQKPQRWELLWRVEQPIFAARWVQFFLGQRLQTLLLASAFGVPGGEGLGMTAFRGWVARAEANYALTDTFKVGLGYITYQPPSHKRDPNEPHPADFGPIYGLTDTDRLYLNLRWDFFLD